MGIMYKMAHVLHANINWLCKTVNVMINIVKIGKYRNVRIIYVLMDIKLINWEYVRNISNHNSKYNQLKIMYNHYQLYK
jgi:hypothetical protein